MLERAARFISLDIFRGLTIALMVIVNNQGDWNFVYRPLKHSAWNGWLGADFVFPFFLFIAGISISISLYRLISKKISKIDILKKIFFRSFIIFLLGIIINAFPDFKASEIRIPGVLQRIAVCYLAASLIFLFFKNTARICIGLSLLFVYWLMLLYFPSCAACDPLSPHGNLVRYIDMLLLGKEHLYLHGAAPGFDPEGILSTLPAIASTIAGAAAGNLILSARDDMYKLKILTLGGTILTVSGILLDTYIPINKNLWTPSYVLFTAGIACIVYSLIFYITEHKKITAWAKPFTYIGENAIAIFFFSTLYAKASVYIQIAQNDGSIISLKALIYKKLFLSWLGGYNASLAYSIMYLLIWLAVAYILHRKNILIKI